MQSSIISKQEQHAYIRNSPIDFLLNTAPLRDQPAEIQLEITKHGSVQRFKRGDVIDIKKTDTLLALIDGMLQVSLVTENTLQHKHVKILHPGDWFIFFDTQNVYKICFEIESLTKSRIFRANNHSIRSIREKSLAHENFLLDLLCQQWMALTLRLALIAGGSKEQRVALVLAGYFRDHHSAVAADTKVPVSKKTVAAHAAVSMSALRQILGRFHTDGLIRLQGTKCIILDMRRLIRKASQPI